MNKVGISYLLWSASFIGLAGLHRLYNGQIVTGLLWLFTWGLFGIGQFIDLFLIPSMVEQHNLKIRPRLEQNNYYTPLINTAPPDKTLSQSQLMILLTKAAQKRGGKISLTQAVLDTELSYDVCQAALDEMIKRGYVIPDNHPETGIILYNFLEL